MAAVLPLSVGASALEDTDPFVVNVFATPIAPRAIVRSRIAAMWLGILAASAAVAAAVGGGIATATTVPLAAGMLRAWLLIAPISGGSAMVGLLVASVSSRWSDQGRNVLGVAVAIVASAVLFVAFIGALGGVVAFAPVRRAGLDVGEAFLRWTLGIGGTAVLLGVVGGWGLSGVVTATALTIAYPVPGRFGSRSAVGALRLAPEQAPQGGAMDRLRAWLRFRYRDYGSGTDAIRGQVVTLYLRGGGLAFVGMTGLFLGFLTFLFAGEPGLFAVVPLLSVGVLFGWMCASASFGFGPANLPIFVNEARLLPLSPRAVLRGGAVATSRLCIGIGVATGVGIAVVTLDPLAGALGGLVVGSVVFLLASVEFLTADRVAYPGDAASGSVSARILYLSATIVPLIGGESALTVLLPSPNGWNPFWLPFAVESAINLVLIWRLLPVMERRLVAPHRSA